MSRAVSPELVDAGTSMTPHSSRHTTPRDSPTSSPVPSVVLNYAESDAGGTGREDLAVMLARILEKQTNSQPRVVTDPTFGLPTFDGDKNIHNARTWFREVGLTAERYGLSEAMKLDLEVEATVQVASNTSVLLIASDSVIR